MLTILRSTIPIPPDTIASGKEEIQSLIEAALRNAGKGDFLTNGQIEFEVEKTFPVDQSIIVGLTLLSGIALETYKAIILPELKRRFKVNQKLKRKKAKGRK